MRFNNKNLGIGGIRHRRYYNCLDLTNPDPPNSNLQSNKSAFTHQTKLIIESHPHGLRHSKNHIITNGSKRYTINEVVYGTTSMLLIVKGTGNLKIYWEGHAPMLDQPINIPNWAGLLWNLYLVHPKLHHSIVVSVDGTLQFREFELYYNADTKNSNFHFTAPVNIT